MGRTLESFATGLFALAFLAGCVATDINSPTEGASNSPRSGGQLNTESKPEAAKVRTTPTHRILRIVRVREMDNLPLSQFVPGQQTVAQSRS